MGKTTRFDSNDYIYNPDSKNTVKEVGQEKQVVNSKTILKSQKETRTGNLASRSILLASEEF